MKIKIKFVNYSHIKIEADDSTIYNLRDHFSFEAEGYRFHPKYKSGMWNGKINLLQYNGMLPFGLYPFVVDWAKNNEQECEIDPLVLKLEQEVDIKNWIKDNPVYSNNKEITPHWYQEDSLKYALDNKRCILNLPTSSGKSLIQGMISKWFVQRNNDKVLVLVPSISLVNQMTDDYIDYRLFNKDDIQMIGNGKKSTDQTYTKILEVYFGTEFIKVFTTDQIKTEQGLIQINKLSVGLQVDLEWIKDRNPLVDKNTITQIKVKTIESPVVVSTWQSAIKQKPEWFEQFGMLINDEMHSCTGASITKINNNLYKCRYKIGLTGSLKDGKANIMQYIGLFGAIFRPVTTKKLMDDGQVTELSIKSIFLKYPDLLIKKLAKADYQTEIKAITSYKKRNLWITNLAKKLADKNENVFIMFRHKEHGRWLYEELEKIHNNIVYIDGDVKSGERETAKTDMELKDGMIAVASYGVFSTGISIKNLHHIIFAHPVKSKVTVVQSIGRVLRKHESKQTAVLWDITDDAGVETKSKNAKNKYSRMNYALTHSFDRIERYIQEDFNFSLHKVQL